MRPGDVQTFKRGESNAVVVGLALWPERDGPWIQIHLTGPDESHITVTNDPKSARYHSTLFRDLRQTLIRQDCWPFGEEGAEETESESEESSPQPAPRFHPIAVRGEPVSESMLRDRERL
jgi:hypothetical protein